MRIRPVKIHTHRENILFLRKDSELCRAQHGSSMEKLEVLHGDRTLVGTLDMVEEDFLEPGEVGLSEYAFEVFGLPAGTEVEVRHPEPVRSVELIRKKIHGEVLGQGDYRHIIRDIVSHRYSRVELTAFVVSCAQASMERDEILFLAQAMVEQGEQLSWGREMVVDKHCIGGIPGNRTTMVVIPIVAAYGLAIPKTSSRAITSPAGTADTMEVLCDVNLSLDRMRAIVEKESGCVAWGGAFTLSPADDIIISVERPLNIDASGQMIASILSKKKAAGATHVLVDIPVGPTAKVGSQTEAFKLRKLFEFVGEHMGMTLDVIITDGSQPVGRGIGPVLEARDVMQVLRNDPEAPRDFTEKCLDLAGRVIDFHPAVRGGYGRSIAEEILRSGRALDKMERIIQAQGPKPPKPLGGRVLEAKAAKPGRLSFLDNHKIAKCAKLAGAPTDMGAGVDLLKKLGDSASEGEPLFRIHAEEEADLGYAWDYWLRHPEMIAID
jgi:thymidine phosphorylase